MWKRRLLGLLVVTLMAAVFALVGGDLAPQALAEGTGGNVDDPPKESLPACCVIKDLGRLFGCGGEFPTGNRMLCSAMGTVAFKLCEAGVPDCHPR